MYLDRTKHSLVLFLRDFLYLIYAFPATRATRKKGSCFVHFRPTISIGELKILVGKRRHHDALPSQPSPIQDCNDLILSDCQGQMMLPFRGKPFSVFSSIQEWFNQIPPPIRLIVSAFIVRQWNILSLFRVPGVIDLADAPGLVFCLASPWIFHPSPHRNYFRAIRSLIKKKRSAIVAYLGYPETSRKLFSKIEPKFCTIPRFIWLKTAILQNHEVLKALLHLKKINPTILRISCDPGLFSHVRPIFLESISEDTHQVPVTAYLLRQVLEAASVLGRPAPVVISEGHLRKLHEKYMHSLLKSNNSEGLPIHLPPPPFPAPCSGDISPLDTPEKIRKAADNMANCIAERIHMRKVAQGSLYFYLLESAKERAVFSLIRRPGPGAGWQLGDIKGPSNLPVSRETVAFVKLFVKTNVMFWGKRA
jgi:hypothetical protein